MIQLFVDSVSTTTFTGRQTQQGAAVRLPVVSLQRTRTRSTARLPQRKEKGSGKYSAYSSFGHFG